MDDFWKALIAGLTPESKREVEMMWKIPLLVFLIFVFLGLF